MDHSSGLVFRRPQATLTADLWSIFAPPFSSGQQAPVSISILMAEMTLLRLLALRLGQELARRPEARAKAKEALVKTQRLVNEELKPRAQQAWREAQPEIETAKRRLKSFAEELRAKYRKG